jgi:DNA polymerase V
VVSKDLTVDIFKPDLASELALPYANDGIQAGFPSPAQDYISESIDLNRELIQHPASTFYGRVSGDSMIGDGIEQDDILVIDRSIEPADGDLAVCCIDGEFTLKRIRLEANAVWLIPSNEEYDPILVTPENRFEVWGVVTYTIKQQHRARRF